VCAVEGRIVVTDGRPSPAGPIRFGASRHLTRILVACGKEAPSVRAVCNLRPSPALERAARRARLTVARFDRADEPKRAGGHVKTMSWGTTAALRASRRTPDVIVDQGAAGKEPMARVLGRTPADVVAKVLRIA
jgi:hydroxymethylpyrimidine/phosphomethylpyrimidine kinase